MKPIEQSSKEEREELVRVFKFIKYVNLKDAWEAVRSWLFMSALLSVLVFGFSYLFSAVVQKTEWIWADIPKRIFFFVGFAVITWILRGVEIKFPVSYNIWLFTVSFVGLIVLASFVFPTWATVSFWLVSGYS